MYLVSVLDDQPVIEASLGGRVELIEMKLFAEEVESQFETWNGDPFFLVLDYSKTANFDEQTAAVLNRLKDRALRLGAARIVSVPQDDSDLEDHVAGRLQSVLEGREEFLVSPLQAKFPQITRKKRLRRAA